MLAASPAAADPNDLALNRLSYFNNASNMPSFTGGCGTGSSMFAQCFADNQLFFNLVNQLGGAMAPSLMAPAHTIGYGGTYIGYEHSISNINGNGEYWRRGTLGSDRDLALMAGTSTGRERVPNSLFVSRFHVRHGFPYGFELGLQTSYLHDSNLAMVGLDVRWAPLEGFRTGVGYLPDFAVRGSVNTLIGNPQMYLTVVGIDASLSKQFTIGGTIVITPYLGGQALMILGDSTVIDATPTRSSYAECPQRQVVFQRDPDGRVTGSELVCVGGTTPMGAINDSHNEMVFEPARILRWRGFGGLRFRYGIFTITGEFTMDVTNPGFLSTPGRGLGRPAANGTRTNITLESFSQWMTSIGVGVQFN